jgi:hypothetical protein
MDGLRNLEKGYESRKFALSYCADDVWAALEAAEKVADAYTAESEDHSDGEFALWNKDDLINAIVRLRQLIA